MNLVNEGLLVRRQGKGTFVREGFTKIKNIKTLRLSGDLNNILPEGLKAQDVKLLDIAKIRAPKEWRSY